MVSILWAQTRIFQIFLMSFQLMTIDMFTQKDLQEQYKMGSFWKDIWIDK